MAFTTDFRDMRLCKTSKELAAAIFRVEEKLEKAADVAVLFARLSVYRRHLKSHKTDLNKIWYKRLVSSEYDPGSC